MYWKWMGSGAWLCIGLLAGCAGPIPDNDDSGASGAMSQAWTAEVPSGGGTLTVDGTGTQADGVRITFPPDALPGGTAIGLAADAEKVKVRDGRWAGYSLSFTVAGDPEFGQPVTVVIPIPEKMRSAIAIAYQVDPDGSLHLMDATQPRGGAVLEVRTWKPCRFTLVYEIP